MLVERQGEGAEVGVSVGVREDAGPDRDSAGKLPCVDQAGFLGPAPFGFHAFLAARLLGNVLRGIGHDLGHLGSAEGAQVDMEATNGVVDLDGADDIALAAAPDHLASELDLVAQVAGVVLRGDVHLGQPVGAFFDGMEVHAEACFGEGGDQGG